MTEHILGYQQPRFASGSTPRRSISFSRYSLAELLLSLGLDALPLPLLSISIASFSAPSRPAAAVGMMQTTTTASLCGDQPRSLERKNFSKSLRGGYNAGMKTTKRQVLGRPADVIIQRTLAVLWIGVFIAVMSYWLWAFLNKSAPAYDGIHALQSPLFLFGIVASIFLFKGAKWARISMGLSLSVSQSERLFAKFCRKDGCGRISWGMMRGSFYHW